MKLIARKPCSFGGQQFYIDNEIPAELVVDPAVHERLGVLTIVNVDDKQSGTNSGQMFTQEQVDSMIAEAIEEAVNNTVMEMNQKQDELQQSVAELNEIEPGTYEETISISVKGAYDGESEQVMVIPTKPEEIRQVFSIMQLNAEEGAKVIAGVTNENVLILLHAADSRKTIKNAAKERACKLFSAKGDSNESDNGNTSIGAGTEGVDT